MFNPAEYGFTKIKVEKGWKKQLVHDVPWKTSRGGLSHDLWGFNLPRCRTSQPSTVSRGIYNGGRGLYQDLHISTLEWRLPRFGMHPGQSIAMSITSHIFWVTSRISWTSRIQGNWKIPDMVLLVPGSTRRSIFRPDVTAVAVVVPWLLGSLCW